MRRFPAPLRAGQRALRTLPSFALGSVGPDRRRRDASLAEYPRHEPRVLDADAESKADMRPKILPHPRVIQSYVTRLLELLEVEPARARDLLARHMPPLVLTPEGRPYRMTGGFNLSVGFDEGADAAGGGEPESMISRVGGTGIELEKRAIQKQRYGAILQSFSRVAVPVPFRLVPVKTAEGRSAWQRGGNRSRARASGPSSGGSQRR